MTSLKTSIKTITYLSDIGCLEIQGASLDTEMQYFRANPVCGQVLNPTLSEALYRGHQPPLHKATW